MAAVVGGACPMRQFRSGQLLRVNPSDASATDEAKALYRWLYSRNQGPIPIGCAEYLTDQDRFGILGPTNYPTEFQAICGEYPAILNLEWEDPDDEPDAYAALVALVKEHYRSGGIVMISDHTKNYAGSGTKNAYDTSKRPADYLSTGGSYATWTAYLDKLVTFFNACEVDGVKVPMLWRPFHEMNGTWFWWGGSTYQADMVDLWDQTVAYVRGEGVHHLLMVWNVNAQNGHFGDGTAADNATYPYSGWFPTASSVDFCSLDFYDDDDTATDDYVGLMHRHHRRSYDAMLAIASANDKPMLLTETGFLYGNAVNTFWETRFLAPLNSMYPAYRAVVLWLNRSSSSEVTKNWAPLRGTAAEESARRALGNARFLKRPDLWGVYDN